MLKPPQKSLPVTCRQAPFKVQLNDRIVVKVSMATTSAAAIQAHFVYDGTRHTSHIQTVLETAPQTSLSFSAIAEENLSKGQAVYISASLGGTPIVAKADNTNATKSRVVGLMAADTVSRSKWSSAQGRGPYSGKFAQFEYKYQSIRTNVGCRRSVICLNRRGIIQCQTNIRKIGKSSIFLSWIIGC